MSVLTDRTARGRKRRGERTFDRVIPASEHASDRRTRDLLTDSEFLVLAVPFQVSDELLGRSSDADAGTPIRDLAESDGVDAFVDRGNASLSVRVEEE